jgi:hypothetical protein
MSSRLLTKPLVHVLAISLTYIFTLGVALDYETADLIILINVFDATQFVLPTVHTQPLAFISAFLAYMYSS